ncbi:MAG: hypothetical protein ACPK85_13385 [Methanosarcina sp.]
MTCLLISNITFACASSSDPLTDPNFYQNNTPEATPTEELETNPIELLTQNPETKSPDNNLTEPLKGNDTNYSKNIQTEDSENTHNKNLKNIRIERSESTQTKKPAVQELPEQWESKPAPPSASVSLHGEKTDVIAGEDILLKLSAVNLITKPPMHVQVIIIPPSGMSVSSSEFVQSGAGQYTTTYELDPGQGRDIEVRIESYQPGEFNVKGRVVYYFGGNIKNAEDYTLELPITVKEKPASPQEALPGFTISGLVVVLIAALILKRNYR